MDMTVNKVMLIGRLGADPETRYTQDGKTVTKFRVATDSGFGENRQTDWHRIVTFDKTAQLCEKYLKKGRQVFLEGRISYNKWEKDGQTHWSTDIIAYNVQFLSPRDDSPRDEASGSNFSSDSAGYSSGPSSSSSSSTSGSRGSSSQEGSFDDGFSENDIPF
jgi:single-strand DNA-binding protein